MEIWESGIKTGGQMRNGYLMGLYPVIFCMTFPKVLIRPYFRDQYDMKFNQTLTQQERMLIQEWQWWKGLIKKRRELCGTYRRCSFTYGKRIVAIA